MLKPICFLLISSAWAQVEILVVRDSDATRYEESLQGFRGYFQERAPSVSIARIELFPEETSGLQRLKQAIQEHEPKLIFCQGSRATHLVGKNVTDRPIVSALVFEELKLTRRKNLTGVFLEYPLQDQLVSLHSIMPRVDRIGVLYHGQANEERVARAREIANTMGIHLIGVRIERARELPSALADILRRVDVLWGIPDSLVLQNRTAQAVLLASFRQRVPFVGLSSSWVKAGALYSLDWNFEDIGSQCAAMSMRILAGDSIATIAPEPPRELTYILNLKTVQHMKLRMPEKIVQGAKWVYR